MSCPRGVNRSTIVGHRSHAENHIIPALGHIPVDKLTPMHIQSFHSGLAASGYAPNTLHRIHAVLSGALKYALRLSNIQRNPASLVTLPSRAGREVAIPDIAAVRRAIEFARDEEHPFHSAIHLIAYTGIRRGEALALLWNNVDLDNGFILIEASLVPVGGELIVEPPKTASGHRIVDIDQGTADVLAEHREFQHVVKDVMVPAYDDRGRVFANEFGDWILPHSLTAAIKALGARVGFPRMTVHSLRHFHASVALQTGQNIVVVSKRLGHSNFSITSDIYAHALPGWQRQAADAFAEAMEKGG